jgi:hypothetical protein
MINQVYDQQFATALKDTESQREVQFILLDDQIVDINIGSPVRVDLKPLTFSALLQRFPDKQITILHSHPHGFDNFSNEDFTTLRAWCNAFPGRLIYMGLVTLKQVYTFIQDSVVEKYLEGFTETYEDWAARGKVGERQFECIEYIDNEFVDNNMLV